MQYVENLEKEFVDEIFSTLKKGREELQKKVANWENGIFLYRLFRNSAKKSNNGQHRYTDAVYNSKGTIK